RAVNTVAARLGPDVDYRVADPGGPSTEDPVRTGDAETEYVHERVVVVNLVERDLAAHSGHADAIAVARDPCHDAAQQVSVSWLVKRAEPQGVQQRDRARAHREDVAEDAPDSRRRALVRLDERRVVVALHLED